VQLILRLPSPDLPWRVCHVTARRGRGNIHNSTGYEWEHLKRIRPGPWMMEGRWYDQGWSWLLGVVHRGRRTPGGDGTAVDGSRDAGDPGPTRRDPVHGKPRTEAPG
jgi:hypothetical protein